ncbi:MAG: GNAT family protein [Actinomycetota bacterium]
MQIETDRLILRELRFDDWPSVLEYQSDPRYLEYYEWTERTPEAVQDFVRMLADLRREHPRTKYQLAIVPRPRGPVIGNCGIRMASPEAREADIGYELAPDYWGQGLATEAVRAMVNFGFTELGVHRIWSWCLADNVRSVRVLEKLGMKLEGRKRENEFFKGRWWDTLLYGILEDEWRVGTV